MKIMKRRGWLAVQLLLALCVLPIYAVSQSSAEAYKKPFSPSSDFSPIQTEASPGIDHLMNSSPVNPVSSDAQWDLQFAYSVSDSVGYLANAGAFWTGTEFWVSKWNSDTLAALDTFGGLIQVFTIPGVSGVRSITSDGNNMFVGTANNLIREVNPITKTVVSTITITGNGAGIGSRFLTYDPTLDGGNGGFYIGNFTSDIAAVSLTGATLFTIPAATHGRIGMYGAAYDDISTGGPYLWVFEQPGSPSDAVISQLQLPAGTWTGVSFDVGNDLGLPGTLAGGLFITSGLVPGENTIGGIVQSTPNVLVGYELDFVPISIDAGVTSALPDPLLSQIPGGQVSTVSFNCEVFNFGSQTITSGSVDVEVVNVATNTPVYSASSNSTSIPSLATQGFSFGNWAPGDTGDFLITLTTNTGSQTDQVSTNDSLSFLLAISDSVLGRDQEDVLNNFGVGAGGGQGAVLATKLELPANDTLTSVSALFGAPPAFENVFFTIYAVDPTTGGPQIPAIGVTSTYTFTQTDADSGVFLTVGFPGNNPVLPAGDFFIGANETGSNFGLSVSSGLYEPGSLWFRADNIGGGAWQEANNPVVLKIQGNFAKSSGSGVGVSQVQFLTPNLTFPEDSSSGMVEVSIFNPDSANSTSVDVSLLSSTATPGVDFLWSDTTIVFSAGSSTPISLPIVILEDTVIEPVEHFTLQLTNVTNGFQIGKDTVRIEIQDNDLFPKIFFLTDSVAYEERFDQPRVFVNLTNTMGDTITADLKVIGGTATIGVDYLWSDTTLTFTSNQAFDSEFVPVVYLDDPLDEPLESIVFVLENITGGAILADPDTIRLYIADDDSPFYDISTITADNDGDCVVDSVGVYCSMTGIVTGPNLDAVNLDLTLTDSLSGIKVFGFVDPFFPTPVPLEGDSIWVQGVVGDTLGMAYLMADSIFYYGSVDTLIPAVVEDISEQTENQLVTLECVRVLDTLNWPGPNQAAFIQIENQTDTFDVYLHPATSVGDISAPSSWMNLTGIGAQIDSFAPYKEGYYLVPRYKEDISPLVPGGSFQVSSTILSEDSDSVTVTIILSGAMPDTVAFNVFADSSSTATIGDDFSLADLNGTFGGCNSTDTVEVVLNLVNDSDPEGDETIVLVINFSTLTESDGSVISSDTITFTITEPNSLFQDSEGRMVSIYPNPGSDFLTIEANEVINSVKVLTITGSEVFEQEIGEQTATLTLADLPDGLYLLEVISESGRSTFRWVKNRN